MLRIPVLRTEANTLLRTCVQFIVAVISLNITPSLIADSLSARELLDRMSRGFRELNYQGTFSYQQGDVTQSFRITHAVIDAIEYERLEYMDGERREIVRRGHDLSCIHPGHQLMRLYQQQQIKQTPLNKAGNHLDLGDYYQLSIVGESRIADRDAVELLVSPKDTHRYAHRLSLDKQSGLLLRSIVEGGAGKILERFQFADIDIGSTIPLAHFDVRDHSYQAAHIAPDIPPQQAVLSQPAKNSSSLSQQNDATSIAHQNHLPELANGIKWQVNWLPAGFTAVVVNQKLSSEDMLTFTDGFSVFSVFLEKIDMKSEKMQGVDSTRDGHASRGATIAHIHSLILSGFAHRVTVIGEIPTQTAQQVAQSVAMKQP